METDIAASLHSLENQHVIKLMEEHEVIHWKKIDDEMCADCHGVDNTRAKLRHTHKKKKKHFHS